jgi:TetR/AcrR family transcriptional regulator
MATAGRPRTRDLILRAAVDVAFDRGIAGATMDEIAERAAVAKGSLYYNFESKDALFEAVIRAGFAQLGETLAAARQDQHGPAAFRAAIRATLALIADDPRTAKIVTSEVFRTERPWVERMELPRQSVLRQYAELASEALGSRARTPVSGVTGAAVFGAIAMAGLDWLLFHPELALDQVVQEVATLLGLAEAPG